MNAPRRRRRVWVGVCFAMLAALATVGLVGNAVESRSPAGAPGSTASTAGASEASESPGASSADTALAAVDTLTIKGRAPMTGYERSAYGDGWSAADGCSTREVILRRDLDDVTVAGAGDCAVVAGTLHDPYTGATQQLGATTLPAAEIDHVVALGDSWQKGAQQWDDAKRVEFANDPLNLLVTTASANASKGDGDTATWLPPNKSFRCAYVARQASVEGEVRAVDHGGGEGRHEPGAE